MFVSVTMGERNGPCFSPFLYCQNTGTRLSVDISCSYTTVVRFNNRKNGRERHPGTRRANKEMYILPHRGIFQGFLFDNASASCYSFKCQRAVLYVLYTFFKRYNLYMCIILGLVTGQLNFLVYEGYKIVRMYCIVYENQYKTCLYCK